MSNSEHFLHKRHIRDVDLLLTVIVLEIADDCGLCGVFGPYLGLASNDPAILLIEISGVSDIGRYQSIAVTYAVDLNRQSHRHVHLPQLGCKFYNGRSSKTLA